MSKHNIYTSGSQLVVELIVTSGDFEPTSRTFKSPSIKLTPNSIKFLESGIYKTALYFEDINEIDGVSPTSLENAFDSISNLIGTLGATLTPKVTNTEMLAIVSPTESQEVYNTTYNQFYYYNGTGWNPIGSSVDISGKQDISPTDGKLYGLKDGGLEEIVGSGGTSEKYSKVLHYGNSICLAFPGSQWWGTWGMAATIKANDYVHKFLSFIQVESPSATTTPKNLSTWEANPYTFDKTTLNADILSHDLIVLRLGENVVYYADFQNQYKLLVQHIQTVNPNAKLILGGLFWYAGNLPIETAMRNVAYELNLPFAPVKHLELPQYQETVGGVVKGDDGLDHTITNTGVARHPNDAGMLEIAKSLFSVLDFKEEISRTLPQREIYENTILDDSYNNTLLVIKANVTITVPVSLKPYFTCRVYTKSTFTATFIAGAGVTIPVLELQLKPERHATLVKDNDRPVYDLFGETSIIGAGENGTCVFVATKRFTLSFVTSTGVDTYFDNFFIPAGTIKPGDVIELRYGIARISGNAVVLGRACLGNAPSVITDTLMISYLGSSGQQKQLAKQSYIVNTNTNLMSMVAPGSSLITDEGLNSVTIPAGGYDITSSFANNLYLSFFVNNVATGNNSSAYMAYLKVYRP